MRNYTASNATGTLVISPATPAFCNLTPPQTISYGTATVTLGGTLAAGSLPATGTFPSRSTASSRLRRSLQRQLLDHLQYGLAGGLGQCLSGDLQLHGDDQLRRPPSNTTATTVTVNKATATLTLSNLAQTYSGVPEPVTVTTSPAGLSGVSVTYNGSSTAPTAAGSYAVVASLTNADYTASNATGTLTSPRSCGSIYVLDPTAGGALTCRATPASTSPATSSWTRIRHPPSRPAEMPRSRPRSRAGGGGVSKSGNAGVTKTGTPGATGDPLAALRMSERLPH